MNYAFIKNKLCINIVVFENSQIAESFGIALKNDGVIDHIVLLPDGFGIGDTYDNEIWTKQEIPEPVHVPTEEERLAALEMAMSFMLGM